MILINSLLQGDFASAFAWIIAVVIALTAWWAILLRVTRAELP